MKKQIFIFVGIFLFFLLSGSFAVESPKNFRTKCTLSQSGSVQVNLHDYKISIGLLATQTEIFAAEELKRYVKAVSNVELEITKDRGLQKSFVIRKRKDLDLDLSDVDLKGDGFFISNCNSSVIFTGDNDRSLLYSVYSFVEKELGVRFFFPGDDYVPTLAKSKIKIARRVENPSFSIRNHRVTDGPFCAKHHEQKVDWAVKNKMNVDHKPGGCQAVSWAKRGGVYFDWLVHAWDDLLPVAEYFDKHPEYYALVDGIRGGADLSHPNWASVVKICTTNPDVLDLIAKRGIEEFDANPDREMFTITQSDGMQSWFCQCEDHTPTCPSLDSGRTFDSWGRTVDVMTNRMVTFSNEVVKRINQVYPDKKVIMAAYGVSLPPPTIEVHKNVYIDFTHSGLGTANINRSMGSKTAANERFWSIFNGWKEKTDNIFIYEYYPGGGWWSVPVVSNNKFAEDVRLMHAQNVKGYTWQTSMWGLYSPGIWVQSKLLWDYTLDPISLLNEYCNKYFGPAAKYMKQVYAFMENAFMNYEPMIFASANIPGETEPLEDDLNYPYDYLTDDLLNNVRQSFESAKKSVPTETAYYRRIVHQEISLNYAEMLAGGIKLEKIYWQDQTVENLTAAIDMLQKAYDYCIDQRVLAKANRAQMPISENRKLAGRLKGLKGRL